MEKKILAGWVTVDGRVFLDEVTALCCERELLLKKLESLRVHLHTWAFSTHASTKSIKKAFEDFDTSIIALVRDLEIIVLRLRDIPNVEDRDVKEVKEV